MKYLLLSLATCLLSAALAAQNLPPQITTFQATPDWLSNTLTLTYEVSDNENDVLTVSVYFSDNNGENYSLSSSITTLSGDIGPGIVPDGNLKTIVCDIAPLAAQFGVFRVRLVADDEQPFDLQSLVNEVDSNKLRANLEFIEGIRHRNTGAAHLQETRDSLTTLFEQLGMHAGEHTFLASGYTGRNIIGTHAGTAQAEQIVIVDAHYDTVSNAPGADDNGSGTVGVMEIARLLSRYPTQKTVRFIGFDLEESNLTGSKRYVAEKIAPGESIAGVFNFEMIGYYSEEPNTQELPQGYNLLFPDAYNAITANENRGDFITNVGNAASTSLATLWAMSAAQYVPDLKVITLLVPGNGQIAPDLQRSDHAPFWVGGYPALMLTDGAEYRNECYHTPQDTFNEKLSFTFMSRVAQATLAAAAELAEIQHADQAVATFDHLVNTQHVPNARVHLSYSLTQPQRLLISCSDSGGLQDLSLMLSDEKGRRVWQKSISRLVQGDNRIDLPDLPAGVYFATLHHQRTVQTLRLVVAN